MAKIYISYQHTDSNVVRIISNELQKRGHNILIDENILKIGQDWRKVLLDSLREADGVLVLISENSLRSDYVISEIGTARAYVAESSNSKFLIPIIYGDIPIPSIINDLQCIRLNDNNVVETINIVDTAISSFLARQEAVKDNQFKEKQEIELKAADYIADATKALKSREWHNRIVAYLCYILGLYALLYGAILSSDNIRSISTLQDSLNKYPNQIWGIYVITILKSIIVIGLLIAVSKYAFTLGKSFMHEALRNSDRIHAISFGEFFLKAYGEKLTSYNEIKEVFQEWNIDKPSAFSNIDTNSYDPKFSDNLVEIIKTLIGKIKSSD